ncbi:MAG: DUF4139 domain-containing protein [Bacteroidales bacterium]|nr:DUF4139 domain-containing protein [Bacteroidales bacterium]
MKKSFLPFILLAVPMVLAAQSKSVPGIEKVTVFTDGAQVERSVTVNVRNGEQTLQFEGISPYFDATSLQVKAKGSLTVLGVSHHFVKADSAQLAQKQTAAKKLLKEASRNVEELNAQFEALNRQAEMVKSNCQTTNRTVVTPLENIRQLKTYYYNELLSINRKQLELSDQLSVAREVKKQRQKTLDSLSAIQPKRLAVIDVKVDAPAATRAQFSFTYYVNRASWYPTYDLRANSTSQPLHLTYKANISQQTGEEWKNIPVTLSSANPNRSNTAPELSPYWLNFYRPKVLKKNEYIVGRAAGLDASAARRSLSKNAVAVDGIEEMNMMDMMEPAAMLDVAASEAKFGYEFAIGHPLTILSDNQLSTATIGEYEIPATYAYQSSPKIDKDAFLMAFATDWDQFNLLGGEAMVFYENSFVGKTYLDPTQQNDTLSLSLGRDNGIRIERKLQKANSSRKVLGSTQTLTKDWQISIRNSRSEKVTLKVFDQIPVSQNSEITVSVLNLSGGELNKETGIVTWTLTLEPDQTRQLNLSYQVKFPKNKSIVIE